MKAEIYSRLDCSFCEKAKAIFEEHNIAYKEFIVSNGFGEIELKENQQYVSKADLLDKLPTVKTVPQIWLEGNYIGGYTEFAEFMMLGERKPRVL